MKLDHYYLTSDEPFTTYEFISEGPKGRIKKLVQFSHYGNNIYNLGFGDKNPDNEDIDDTVVTDNGDSEKVLATVLEALYQFSEKFTEAKVYATGSTPSRTRLYRMGINKYYDKATTDFDILGRTEAGWETYEKGKDYRAFIVQRKQLKFEL